MRVAVMTVSNEMPEEKPEDHIRPGKISADSVDASEEIERIRQKYPNGGPWAKDASAYPENRTTRAAAARRTSQLKTRARQSRQRSSHRTKAEQLPRTSSKAALLGGQNLVGSMPRLHRSRSIRP
jgi:hypothetical protein